MEKITFLGSSGDLLSARLDLPEQSEPKIYALFAHCFTCSKDIFAASRITRRLNALNIAVLRFDFTGLGMSEGDFANTNFTSNIRDLVLAADHMRETLVAPALLIGHSFGGTACIKAALEIPEIKAVATIGAPADTHHIQKQFACHREEIIRNGEAEVMLAGRAFKLRRQFIEDVEAHNIEDDLANLRRALLILHSPIDDTVSIDNAGRLFSIAKHPKSFVSLNKADHLLRRGEDAEYAASVIAAWVDLYVL
jgi:pimeloyl-ACP methyl ester carboxylesterase